MFVPFLEGQSDDIHFITARSTPETREQHIMAYNLNNAEVYDVESFELFCHMAASPKDVMISFKLNEVQYENHAMVGKRAMYWPEEVMRRKRGNCFDFGFFMHLFLKSKKIEHALGFTLSIAHRSKIKGIAAGHCFPIYRSPIDRNLWIWNYFGSNQGDINGPFDSYENIIDEAGSYYSILYNSEMHAGPTTSQFQREPMISMPVAIANEDELEILDRAYANNDRNEQDMLTGSLPSVQRQMMQFLYYRDALLKGAGLRKVLEIFYPEPSDQNIQKMFKRFFKDGK